MCPSPLWVYMYELLNITSVWKQDTRLGYINSKRMAVSGIVERLCKEEDVGHVDLWDCFVGKEEMYVRDGLHLSGKGAAVFAEGLSGAVASGFGKVRYPYYYTTRMQMCPHKYVLF